MDTLKRLLTPPVFEDEINTEQAYMLHIIVWTLICVPIPYLIFIYFKGASDLNRALVQAAFGEITNIILLIILRRGFVRAASIIQVSAFWFFFTATAITGSGVQGVAYLLGYGLVIAIAGILIGGTGALIFTFLSLTAGGLMVYEQAQGVINSSIESSPYTTWIVSFVLFPVGAVLQHLAARKVRNALERAHASEERYRLISSVSSDYTFSTELDSAGNMRLNWVAGALERITGYTYEDYVKNGGWHAHLHPDDVEKDAQDTAMLKTNKPVVTEIRTFTKDQELHWVRVYAHPVWDEKQNRLTGIVGAVQDITEQKQTEIALTRERDLLQLFMDNIPDTVYFKDIASRFIRVNKAQAQFLKLTSPQEAIGKTDLDFQPLEIAQQFMDEEKRIVETDQPVFNRLEFNPTEDGTPRWLSATKVPVKDSSRRVIGTIGISRDITDQKESQERLQKLFLQQSAILDNIPDMAWLKDKDSRYTAVNEAFAQIAGMKKEEIFGKLDADLWPKHLAENFRNNDLAVMETKQVLSIEEMQADSVGREFWIETFKTPILNDAGEVIGTTGISRDISERKYAEQEREQLITELENRNAELELFMYTVSHDLKSPVITMRGFLGYIEQDALSGNYQRLKMDVERIAQAADKMQRLLNDLLELPRIRRETNLSENIAFSEIVNEALAQVRDQVEAQNIQVEVQEGMPIVCGDRIRLMEVVQNLVENSAKFMGDQEKPNIEIGARGTDKEGKHIFFVRDNGIGIQPQYHDRIFGLFNKLDAQAEGTGIGLTLVKRVIEVHGGNIWVESELGKGATFYFTLPGKAEEK